MNANSGGKARAVLGLLAVAGLILAACGTADPLDESGGATGGDGGTSEGGEVSIVYSLYDREAAFFRGCLSGIEARAEELGVDLKVLLSGYDPSKQISQIETAIQQQPDALIITPADSNALAGVSEQVIEAGIPVFGVCDDIGSGGEEAGDSRISYVGPDYRLIGEQKAEFAVEAAGPGGKIGRYYGLRGVPFDQFTRAGEAPVFEANPDVEVVKGPYAGAYTTEAGVEVTQNLLTAHPDLDVILCDMSDLCVGSVQAVQERGIDFDDIVLVSEDGIEPELEAVKQGQIDYSIAFCAYDEGVTVMNQAYDFVTEGVQPPELTIDVGREYTPETIPDDVTTVEEPCAEPSLEVKIDEPKTELIDQVLAAQQ
jgi:ABC-type sugar transport system substrate-binding protein